jgi:hypothetical protein
MEFDDDVDFSGQEHTTLDKVPAHYTELNFLHEDLVSFLKSVGMTPGRVEVSVHNVDWTRVGEVKFTMIINGEEVEKTYILSGGIFGAAEAKSQGMNIIHTNTTEQSASEIEGYLTRNDKNKGYAVLLALLNEANSFGNPLVFDIAMDLFETFVRETNNKNHISKAAKTLNRLFAVQLTSSDIKEYQNTDEGIQAVKIKAKTYVGQALKSKLNVVGRSLDIPTSGITTEEQRVAILEVIKKIRNGKGLGFELRGKIASYIFKPRAGLGEVAGFITSEEFLDGVNEPSLKGANPGDIFAGTYVASKDRQFVESVADLKDAGVIPEGAFSDGMAYVSGTVIVAEGHGVKPALFKNPSTTNQILKAAKIKLEARQRTTGKFPLSSPRRSSKKVGFKIEKEVEQAVLQESRRLLGRLYVEGGDSWTASTPTPYGAVLQRAALRLQDKYSDVMLLQQDIEVFKGNKVVQSQDFEMAMDLYYGLVRTDFERIEAMLDDINETAKKFNIAPEDLSDYLYARHAQERNRFINERREDIEDGSGMTNEEAEAILEELESPEMRVLADKVYAIVDFTRKYMVEGGLEPRAVVEEWENRFQNYVPLNGLAEDEMDEATSSYPTGGAGMAVYGPSTRKAKGRTSRTGANILGNVVMQSVAVVQRARKDQAMLSLYRLAEANPNPAVWSVHGPNNPFVSAGRALTDEQMKKRQDVVPLRINGKQHFIRFKSADYARALNGMTLEKLDWTSRQAAKYVGFLRNSYTVWNPAFFISNFMRDLTSAVYNAAAEIDREGGILQGYGLTATEFNKKLLSTTLSSLKALLAMEHGQQVDPELVEFLEEWKAAGGRTGWSYSDSLNKLVTQLNDKTVGKSKAGEALSNAWGKSFGAVLDYVEGLNEAFENALRLSAYIEARRAGMSKQRAAQLSKNITVNFNKTGELSPSINSWFLFFNAAVQGMARFSRSFLTLKQSIPQPEGASAKWRDRVTAAQKLGIGVTMLSYAQTVLNILMSARDDDDELKYAKIADYVKQRNQIIMLGGEDWLTVPLPYGMNIFNNVGMILAEVSMGVRDIDDAGIFLALSAQSSFSPISFGQGDNLIQGAVSTLMPTFLKPATEVAFNSTYFGGKVYQEQYPFGTEVPEYTLAFRSPEFVVEMNKYLNEMSGGAEKITGDLDFNPDPYYYLMLSMLGGAGKFTGDVIDLGVTTGAVVKNAIAETDDNTGFLQALIETEKPKIKRTEIPFIKLLYGEASRFYDFDMFDGNRLDVEQHIAQAKAYSEGEADVFETLDFTGVGELARILKGTEDILSDIREIRREVRQSEDIDYIKKLNTLYMLEQEETKTIMYFNAKYYDLRGRYINPKPHGLMPEQSVRQALGIDGQ